MDWQVSSKVTAVCNLFVSVLSSVSHHDRLDDLLFDNFEPTGPDQQGKIKRSVVAGSAKVLLLIQPPSHPNDHLLSSGGDILSMDLHARSLGKGNH
jgi:hypothetical protein